MKTPGYSHDFPEKEFRDQSLDDSDVWRLKKYSRTNKTDLSVDKIKKLLGNPQLDFYVAVMLRHELPEWYTSLSHESRAAICLWEHRVVSPDGESTPLNIAGIYADQRAKYGLEVIGSMDQKWRFRACMNCIVCLDEETLEAAFDYINSFRTTEYFDTLQAFETDLTSDCQEWDSKVTDTDNAQLALDVYRSATSAFERGFPFLLGFKQVFTGQGADIEQLQSMRASKVRRELQKSGPDRAHVYFDEIVSAYESGLRNGIAHGDIMMEPTADKLRIPSENITYSYEEVTEIGLASAATVIFLAGVFPNLITREYAVDLIDPISSPPEWLTSGQ